MDAHKKRKLKPANPVPFKIEWITPWAPSYQVAYMLDLMPFRASLLVDTSERHPDPNEFAIELWTNLYHDGDNEGEWHAVALTYQGVTTVKDNNTACFLYGNDLLLTCEGKYSFTFRARSKIVPKDQHKELLKQDKELQKELKQDKEQHKEQHKEIIKQDKEISKYTYAQGYRINGRVHVIRSLKHMNVYLQEADMNKITSNVYLGNYEAALVAAEWGFECLLNLADDAPIFPMQLAKPIIYRRCPIPDGADKPIPEITICQTVNWLRAMSERCHKILVHSRDGFGRAGSIMIAFVFAYNRNLSFEEVIAFLQKRRFVYNHRGLRDTLYKIYPRE